MSHDPMCPNIPEQWDAEQSILWHAKCECDLIASVRADERKYGMVPGFDLGYAAALRDAAGVVVTRLLTDRTVAPRVTADLVAAIEGLEGDR